MSIQQIILTGESPEQDLHWIKADDGNLLSSGISASVQAYAETVYDLTYPLIAVLPGERFSLRQIESPAKSRQQILQSARFLLEDDFACPVDGLHLALAVADQDNTKVIVATEKSYIENWLASFSACGVKPTSLTADFLCLKLSTSEAVAFVENDRLLFHAGTVGFATDRQLGVWSVEKLMPEADLSELTVLAYADEIGFASPAITIDQYRIEDTSGILKFYANSIFAKAPVNLLQGDLELGIEWSAFFKPWRQAAAMLAASIALFLTIHVTEAVKFNVAADQLTSDARSRFTAAYPDATLRNLRAQARQRAGASTEGNTDFLNLTGKLTVALEQNSSVKLSLLTYDRTGMLTADLQFFSLEDLDALKAALSEQGLQVQEGRTLTPVGNVYTGKLTMRSRS